MKQYSKGIWRGEDTQFDNEELKQGGRYRGTFLVFEDGPNYLGSVLFTVYGGRVTAKCMRGYWEFKEENRVPTEIDV